MKDMNQRTLRVEFLDPWHVGSGRGQGVHLDAVVERDVDGLPYVPGRLLRGAVRDAAEDLCAWRQAASDDVADLFGRLLPPAGLPAGLAPRPGRLRVSDARLPEPERAWLAREDEEAQAARGALFMSAFQTALDGKLGTAKSGSLRGIELVVPLALEAVVEVEGDATAAARGWALFDRALPLVRALGAHKSRGHGRVQLRWLGGRA